MRRSHVFFLFVLLCLGIISGLAASSYTLVSKFRRSLADMIEITRVLRLTDMSFSHDARYTRNPSQADLFSAFQDYPGSIEHFPSGSVVTPPDFTSLGTQIVVKPKTRGRVAAER